eukprot:CAMPEP_0179247258 /NCGR_PEP_ID=MMETSP0797-20121207/19516_1 /TAXON_ID=47934 /ORGANISM="Dinophysis acuminata, Strain DAEP01" /LENGTH=52 /DNA_ID=CAMNT_0020954871 /DNA_START=186 /DNA_END=341 /DNA_ORIENTATION=+
MYGSTGALPGEREASVAAGRERKTQCAASWPQLNTQAEYTNFVRELLPTSPA